jgi:hypothetical protein
VDIAQWEQAVAE